MNATKIGLEDVKINVKAKLSALWASVMFCYVYGDIFSLHQPGVITDIMSGKMGPFSVTPGLLLGFSLFMAVPAVMVFLSLALKPKVSRRINIVLGIFYLATNSLSAFSSTWAYFIGWGIIEGILNALIIWYAWKWPKQANI